MASKFVAKGGYGCVFQPALSCQAGNPAQKNAISKVFFTKAKQVEEIRKNTDLQALIDPDEEFTVRMYGACRIPRDLFDYSQCGREWQGAKKTYQIVYEFGGEDLGVAPKTNFSTFLEDTESIFFALVKMYAAEVTHNDIKTDNILYNPVTHKMILIDFGEAEQPEVALATGTSIFNRGAESDFLPPDFELYKILSENASRVVEQTPSVTVKTILSSVMRDAKNVRISYVSLLNGTGIYNDDVIEEFKELYNVDISFIDDIDMLERQLKTHMLYSIRTFQEEGRFPLFPYKTDLYGLGMTLFVVMLMIHKKDRRIDIIGKAILPLFIALIKNMISVDPSSRYSAEEALDAFLRIKGFIKKYKLVPPVQRLVASRRSVTSRNLLKEHKEIAKKYEKIQVRSSSK